jgi:hypothetical protein
MVWSPILERGKYHAPSTPNPPPVYGSPRYYQVTGLKPPKAPKSATTTTTTTTTRLVQESNTLDYDTMSIDSFEKPILEQPRTTAKSSKLAKKLGLKK